jgi:ferric-dicitrate binding protein FerR (iron transport regulator)
MKSLAESMRDDDPLLRDPALSDAEAVAIRRRAVDAAVARSPRRLAWREAMAIAAAVVLMIAAGVTAGRRMPPPATPAVLLDDGSAQPGERRQLQFATPGGTRIIWTFDPEFSLKGTMP